jgi:hypothetical protein
VEGFPSADSYAHRPLVVYVCPPDKCGGSLDWMRWQEDAAAACGTQCLWVDRMPCHSYADVVLLSCYAAPAPGFAKWPHQVWAYLCMEADTRRHMLSDNLLRYVHLLYTHLYIHICTHMYTHISGFTAVVSLPSENVLQYVVVCTHTHTRTHTHTHTGTLT